MKARKHLGYLIASTVVFTAQTNAIAQDQPPLQGSVQKVELSLEKLRDIGLDLKQVLKATSNLYDEVTIQPVSMITEPEVIGRGIIINIPIGTMPVGPVQPPRKSRVDAAMAGIKPVISTLKTNVDEFVSGKRELDIPQEMQAQLKPDFDKWVATVNDVAAREATLEQLTQGPNYDNASIAAATQAIQKDVKTLDETRRAVYKAVRKSAKKES